MKIGVVSDIHCNAAGLKAALQRLDAADEILCLGDSILEFRFSNEVAAILRERNADTVVMYLATAPSLFTVACEQLAAAGLAPGKHIEASVFDPATLRNETMVIDVEAREVVRAAGLWTTLCDPHQLESAILNLAINCRDAMPDGGRLTIETCNAPLDNAYTARERAVKAGHPVVIGSRDAGRARAAARGVCPARRPRRAAVRRRATLRASADRA